jgi:hypothetical protein
MVFISLRAEAQAIAALCLDLPLPEPVDLFQRHLARLVTIIQDQHPVRAQDAVDLSVNVALIILNAKSGMRSRSPFAIVSPLILIF